ncbi:MAG: hypothetical protein JWN10_1669 [Solirubrobacterales bacterium]|nr:hypothetical protein [Solirubrobacterales bacterium]
MTPGDSNLAGVPIGSLWRHKSNPRLTKEVARITSAGKILGPGTSRSGRTLSVATLLRDYECLGMREPTGRMNVNLSLPGLELDELVRCTVGAIR